MVEEGDPAKDHQGTSSSSRGLSRADRCRPELATYLRIEERELEAGGLN